MFNLGIAAVTVGIACPGARRIVFIEMVSGEQGFMTAAGIITWLKLK
jgi:hypothetical protein